MLICKPILSLSRADACFAKLRRYHFDRCRLIDADPNAELSPGVEVMVA